MPLPVTSESSTTGDHIRWRKPRNQITSISPSDPKDPNINNNIPSIIQSTRCKSTISSLFLSTFTTTNSNPENSQNNRNPNNKKGFKGSTFRGFGCTAPPEVAAPAVIRSSADWEENRKKKNGGKKKKKTKKKSQGLNGVLLEDPIGSVGIVHDLWCGPGIGGTLSGRGKIDLDKVHHIERASYSSRQRVNPDNFASLDLDPAFEIPRLGPDVFESRYYHHLGNRSPEGLAEIMMFQNGLLSGRRSSGLDRYRDWRLDVDDMTYEELLELGDRIGYVSTGLAEDQIGQCLRKTKLSVLDELSSESHITDELEGKCSICQEEYEAEDEMGKLECGHAYHLHCIKQWLAQKNACPVCKAQASSL